jgi:sugar phosphate isomerase/epimerase
LMNSNGMKPTFFCPRWGSESFSPAEFLSRVREAGYDGVEVGLADGDTAADEVIALAKEAGLPVITQHWQTMTVDFPRHLDEFEARLRRAASSTPLFINSHTGRDCFSLEQNLAVFAVADKVSAETGVAVCHETHRGRCLHTPWRTAELLRARPSTRLVLDMSHWCNVCESLCEDQEETIIALIRSVDHIHGRVGHAQGAQVSDPRAPEWREAVEVHVRWWQCVAAAKHAAGAESLTITPEFGPPPYLPVLPWTQSPVAPQWDINLHMMNMLRDRLRAPYAQNCHQHQNQPLTTTSKTSDLSCPTCGVRPTAS